MSVLRTFAPAKLNLYLHITGVRADGYHELDSLVAFCGVGDELRLDTDQPFGFSLEGPLALSLSNEPIKSNLAVRAAKKFADAVGHELTGHLTLVKNLPVASGIGGGSSDAAATLRLFARAWNVPLDDPSLYMVARRLGQDIPCCIKSETCCFREVGDVMDPGPELPLIHCILVNPHLTLPTPSVFKAHTGPFSAAAPMRTAPADLTSLVAALQTRNNDLTEAACGLLPEVKKVLLAIDTSPNCLLARMSGSGATCFGLYPDRGSAKQAVAKIFSAHPDWWVVASTLPYLLRDGEKEQDLLTNCEEVA